MGHETRTSCGDASELEPETVLPQQFFSPGIDASRSPEKSLMLAVLAEAMGTFRKYATARDIRGRRLWEESAAWIAADETEWLFSFVNICHALELDVDWLRARLWRWRDRERVLGDRATVIRMPSVRLRGTRHMMITGRATGLSWSA